MGLLRWGLKLVGEKVGEELLALSLLDREPPLLSKDNNV
jgi:hypothetical protein